MTRFSILVSVLLVGILVAGFMTQPAWGTIETGGWFSNLFHTKALKEQSIQPLVVPRESSSYRDVVKTILPAVVSIESRGAVAKSKSSPEFFEEKRFGPDWSDLPLPKEFQKFFRSWPDNGFPTPRFEENARLGFGSGFFVDPDGVIVTNNHVVANASTVKVRLHDGRTFTATDIRTDPKTDLAVLRIKGEKPFPYLELGDSSAMEIGDRVLAVGAPFGLTGTVTHGIVSSKGRHLNPKQYEDFIQTDAAINPGNSGGPLVNLKGKVIGVNTLIKSHSGGFQGVGMAISSDLTRHVLGQLLKHGEVRRGYLGVLIRSLEPAVASRLGLESNRGALVTKVLEGSPAEKAGLKEGDIITAIDGKPVRDSWQIVHRVTRAPVNKPLGISLIRDGAPISMNVTIESHPDGKKHNTSFSKREAGGGSRKELDLSPMGLTLSDLSPELADDNGFKDRSGAMITRAEGIAAMAGLRKGMLIESVNRKPVASAGEAKAALEEADLAEGILLKVRSPESGIHFVLLQKTGG